MAAWLLLRPLRGTVFLWVAAAALFWVAIDGLAHREIATASRRHSRLVTREKSPGAYWWSLSVYTVLGGVFVYAGAATLRKSWKRPRK